LDWDWRNTLSNYDARLFAVEQKVDSLHIECLQTTSEVKKVAFQQEQNMKNTNHEHTMLLGMVAAQGEDIKALKRQIEGFNGRFDRLDVRIDGANAHILNLQDEVKALQRQQDSQGQDITGIKLRLDEQGQDITGIKLRLDEQGQDLKDIKHQLGDILTLLKGNHNDS
jgi:chromosome segregation ATPase